MGKLKLINGNFNGKVGAFVGQTYKGLKVIKSVEHKKRHPTTSQTNSVRAFECLNRAASGLVEYLWTFSKLSTKSQLKHNALAQFWKPLIADKTFNLENFYNIYSTSTLPITFFSQAQSNNKNISATWNYTTPDTENFLVYGAIINNYGRVLNVTELTEATTSINCETLDFADSDYYYGICFVIDLNATRDNSNISVIVSDKVAFSTLPIIEITYSISNDNINPQVSISATATPTSATVTYDTFNRTTGLHLTSSSFRAVPGELVEITISATADGYQNYSNKFIWQRPYPPVQYNLSSQRISSMGSYWGEFTVAPSVGFIDNWLAQWVNRYGVTQLVENQNNTRMSGDYSNFGGGTSSWKPYTFTMYLDTMYFGFWKKTITIPTISYNESISETLENGWERTTNPNE